MKKFLAIVLSLGTLVSMVGCNNRNEMQPIVKNEILTNDVNILEEYDVLKTTNSDFINTDSDKDGYTDLVEYIMGTDPNKKDTYTKDNALTYVIGEVDAEVKLEGTPNICTTSIKAVENQNIQNKSLLLSPVYEINCEAGYENNIYNAELTIMYEVDTLAEEDKENVSIYQYMKDGSLSKVDSVVDAELGTVSAKLEHFSRYTVSFGDVLTREGYNAVAIYLSIDDSGSMYDYVDEERNIVFTKEKDCANDSEGKRWDFLLEFAKKVKEESTDRRNIILAVGKYTGRGNKENIVLPENSIDEISQIINDIKTRDMTELIESNYFNGTAIAENIEYGVDFLDSTKAASKYIVILTDGVDTVSTTSRAISALNKYTDITPIMIGLGDNIDADYLSKVGAVNNGMYYQIANIDAISILNQILATAVDGYITLDLPNSFGNYEPTDVEVLADSGFRAEVNGFPFSNTSILFPDGTKNGGLCAGFSKIAQRLYTNTLSSASFNATNITDDILCMDEYLIEIPSKVLKNVEKEGSSAVIERLNEKFEIKRLLSEFVDEDNDGVFDGLQELYNKGILYMTDKTKYTKEQAQKDIEAEDFNNLSLRLDISIENLSKFFSVDIVNNGQMHRIFDIEYSEAGEEKGKTEYYFIGVPRLSLSIEKLKTVIEDEKEDMQLREEAAILASIYDMWATQHDSNNYFEKHDNYIFDLYLLTNISPVTTNPAWDFTIIKGIVNKNVNITYPWEFFDKIVTQVRSKMPACISFEGKRKNGETFGHSVLCQRVLRSVDDPTIYYLEVYDSNFPNKATYIRLDLRTYTLADSMQNAVKEGLLGGINSATAGVFGSLDRYTTMLKNSINSLDDLYVLEGSNLDAAYGEGAQITAIAVLDDNPQFRVK